MGDVIDLAKRRAWLALKKFVGDPKMRGVQPRETLHDKMKELGSGPFMLTDKEWADMKARAERYKTHGVRTGRWRGDGSHTIDVEPGSTLHTIWCISTSPQVAERIALDTVAGKLPRLYEFECDCLSAWRSYPSFGVGAYVPWRLIVSEAPTGLKIVSSSRIGAW